MTKSQIFIRAHQIAKNTVSQVGNYSIALSFALKEVYAMSKDVVITIRSFAGSEIAVNVSKKTFCLVKHGFIDVPYSYIYTSRFEGSPAGIIEFDNNGTPHKIVTNHDDVKDLIKKQAEVTEQKLEQAIPGLKLLQKAMSEESYYLHKFGAAMDNENNDGVNLPSKPRLSSDELKKQYPRASLYIKCLRDSESSIYEISTAGKKAIKLLENGEPEHKAEKIIKEAKDVFLNRSAYN